MNMNINQIKSLVPIIKEGATNDFCLLLYEYKAYMQKQTYRYYAPGLDMDDIYQEASIGLYKAVCSYDESKGDFVPYSFLCIQGHLKNVVKGALRQKHYILNNAYPLDKAINTDDEVTFHAIIPYQPSQNNSPEASYIKSEIRSEWHDFYRYMLSKKEQVILKRYLKGFTYNDISIEMNISEKSVDNALYRIRRKIKKKIDPLYIINIS